MTKIQIPSFTEKIERSDTINPYVFPLLKLSLLNTREHTYLPKSMRMNKDIVVEAIAEEYEMTKEFTHQRIRKRHITEGRQILAYICVFELQMRKTEVGRWLEQDHTTVIHSCKKFQELYKGCNNFKQKVDNIYRRLNLTL